MTAQSNLDLRGNFRTHPFAELLIEIAQAHLSGSLRVSRGEAKVIVYFDGGRLALAVSNERAFRLANTLAEQNVIDRQFLSENPHVANDLQLVEHLRDSGRISAEEAERLITGQSLAIIGAVLSWPDGEWLYSPLTRLKEGILFDINFYPLLFDHAQQLTVEKTCERFRSIAESFVQRMGGDPGLDLRPEQAFVLSRFDTGPMSLEEVMACSGFSQNDAMHALYALWMGGFIARQDWNPAFSEIKIATIRSANIEIKKRAAVRQIPRPRRVVEPIAIAEPDPSTEEEFDLEEQLNRIESAQTYYELFGIEPSAKVGTIRKSYFRMAKLLHPDRYHNEDRALLSRVEKAFTELAQAHETLKNHDSRRAYDIRIKQEAEDRERARASGTSADANKQESQAGGDFERGLRLQLEGNLEAAMPYFARAVYLSPQNARYHAHYGKALSTDETQRHKAEGELQAAIRLEPQNDSFRLLLAEFFIRFNLYKRAEGELNRLLKNSPGNREALALLDTLRSK